MQCLFVSDLHGYQERYNLLFNAVQKDEPDGVFLGGDILPTGLGINIDIKKFLTEFFIAKVEKLKKSGIKTRFFTILGNDDPRIYEDILIEAEKKSIIEYVHNKTVEFGNLFVTGYSYIPPTPFQLKDWEKYDVSRYVDVGAISPEEGIRSKKIPKEKIRWETIADDLKSLSKNAPVEKTIFLFHAPPYKSKLDRAALDGKKIDHVPFDVHVGSIAIQRFIKKEQPFLTLHGHVHESASLTGSWKEKIGKTYSFGAAHDGAELSLVKFNTNNLKNSERILL